MAFEEDFKAYREGRAAALKSSEFRRRQRQMVIKLFSGGATALATFLFVTMFLRDDRPISRSSSFSPRMDILEQKVEMLLAAKSNAPASTPGTNIPSVETRVALDRLSKLENAIQDSPEKALAVPLLRKDIDNLRAQQARDLDAFSRQVDRMYDQGKWLIGLILTSVIGLVLTNIFKREPKAEKEPKSEKEARANAEKPKG